MASFMIKKLKKNLKIKTFDYELDGFHYKINKTNDLDIKEIIIIKQSLINNLIMANFDKKYRKIVSYYFNILASDDDSDDALMIALDEIARLRNILIKKYNNIAKENQNKMLKKLKILENEIRSKIVDFKLIKEQELANTNIEQKGKSR